MDINDLTIVLAHYGASYGASAAHRPPSPSRASWRCWPPARLAFGPTPGGGENTINSPRFGRSATPSCERSEGSRPRFGLDSSLRLRMTIEPK